MGNQVFNQSVKAIQEHDSAYKIKFYKAESSSRFSFMDTVSFSKTS